MMLEVAKVTGVVGLCMVAGYLVGTVILYLLTLIFGAKIGAMIYIVLWGASCVWVFMFIFEKDAYGYRRSGKLS